MTAPEKTQGERKHPNDMTIGECLGELFRDKYLDSNTISGEWRANWPYRFRVRVDTLDEAAKLPEGWDARIYVNRHGVTVAKAFHYDATLERVGNTEKEARFRLRVAVERATRADAAEGGQ